MPMPKTVHTQGDGPINLGGTLQRRKIGLGIGDDGARRRVGRLGRLGFHSFFPFLVLCGGRDWRDFNMRAWQEANSGGKSTTP